MTFLEHLEELRKCIIKSLIGALIGFIVCYAFSEKIYNFLLIPFNEAYRSVLKKEPTLIFTTLFEPFLAYLKISFVVGIFLASPYIFYEIWKFIAPGLYKKEKRLVIPFVVLAALFFIGGAFFGYFFVFPILFKFFIGYSTEVIQPAIKVSDFLKVSLGMLLIFGIVFEFPLVTLFLVSTNIISAKALLSQWRYIIIGMAVLSAIFTPADPLSMLFMMGPLILLYLMTLIVAYLIEMKRKKK